MPLRAPSSMVKTMCSMHMLYVLRPHRRRVDFGVFNQARLGRLLMNERNTAELLGDMRFAEMLHTTGAVYDLSYLWRGYSRFLRSEGAVRSWP